MRKRSAISESRRGEFSVGIRFSEHIIPRRTIRTNLLSAASFPLQGPSQRLRHFPCRFQYWSYSLKLFPANIARIILDHFRPLHFFSVSGDYRNYFEILNRFLGYIFVVNTIHSYIFVGFHYPSGISNFKKK
jgi:hypothetical protein